MTTPHLPRLGLALRVQRAQRRVAPRLQQRAQCESEAGQVRGGHGVELKGSGLAATPRGL